MSCTVYKNFCSVHNFVHGAEAEDLRKGIESIIEENPSEDEWEWKLRRLLDGVDARDSLAYVQAQKAADKEPEGAFYYVQDSRTWVGDSALWWAKDGQGYTSNLDEAHVYTEEEIRRKRWRIHDIPRLKEAVDAMACAHPRAEGQLPPEPDWVRHEKS